MEFLDGRGFSELLYFDSQKQVLKRLLHYESLYLLEPATVEDIVKKFPEHVDSILQYNNASK